MRLFNILAMPIYVRKKHIMTTDGKVVQIPETDESTITRLTAINMVEAAKLHIEQLKNVVADWDFLNREDFSDIIPVKHSGAKTEGLGNMVDPFDTRTIGFNDGTNMYGTPLPVDYSIPTGIFDNELEAEYYSQRPQDEVLEETFTSDEIYEMMYGKIDRTGLGDGNIL